VTIAAQIMELKTLTVRQLREKYLEVFGEPTKSGHKDYLFRKIAWKIQEKEYGGLSERAKRRALEIADESDLRTRPPRGYGKMLEEQLARGNLGSSPADVQGEMALDPRLPAIGAVLTKEYKGLSINVLVRGPRQFEWEGRLYNSLSAIAKEVTGTNYNGYAFFGCARKEKN
jgi:hypothetical protein